MRQPAFLRLAIPLLVTLAAACGGDDEPEDVCQPDDLDGVIGGSERFELTVSDDAFSPRILTAQNRANITLTLSNEASEPRGFFVECLPTPNDDGCATESCFPDDARIDPIAPGEIATAVFELPLVEGAYTIVSEPGAAEPSAQFVVR